MKFNVSANKDERITSCYPDGLGDYYMYYKGNFTSHRIDPALFQLLLKDDTATRRHLDGQEVSKCDVILPNFRVCL